jgi:hypothetical protein
MRARFAPFAVATSFFAALLSTANAQASSRPSEGARVFVIGFS